MKRKTRQWLENTYGQPAHKVLADMLNTRGVEEVCKELNISSATLYYWAHTVGLERRWVKV